MSLLLSTFLSISTPIRKDQVDFLDYLKLQLTNQNIEYNTVENIDENKINPIYPIIESIRKSSFFICIAFEKNIIDNKHVTSNWIDVEYALAISMNKPCLIIVEKHLESSILINQNTPSPLIYIPTFQHKNQFLIDSEQFEYTWESVKSYLFAYFPNLR